MKRVMTMLLAAFALWAAAPSASLAQGAHGCACIHNSTGQTINFRYKWGQEDWRNRTAGPNQNYALCWGYGSGPHVSPPLLFQLDRDMGPGSAWTTYAISRMQSQSNNCAFVPPGVHYDVQFQPGTNNSFIHVTRRAAGASPPGPMPGPMLPQGGRVLACACMHNEVGRRINFQFAWGGAPFQAGHVDAGFNWGSCAAPAAPGQPFPKLRVSIDRDMSAGQARTIYGLDGQAAANSLCASIPPAAHYKIRFQPGTNNQLIHVSR